MEGLFLAVSVDILASYKGKAEIKGSISAL